MLLSHCFSFSSLVSKHNRITEEEGWTAPVYSTSHSSMPLCAVDKRKKLRRLCFIPSWIQRQELVVCTLLCPHLCILWECTLLLTFFMHPSHFLFLNLVGRIALVDPSKSKAIEDRIIMLAQKGQISEVHFHWSTIDPFLDQGERYYQHFGVYGEPHSAYKGYCMFWPEILADAIDSTPRHFWRWDGRWFLRRLSVYSVLWTLPLFLFSFNKTEKKWKEN